MQKNNTRASILIWAIFLSLIISISFLSIVSKINKSLNTNKSIIKEIKKNIKIQNKLKSFSGVYSNFGNIKIYIENKNFKKSLKKYEKINIIFQNYSTGNLILTNSGIIHYEFGSEKGFLDNKNNLYYFSNKKGILKLENYSGISSIQLNSTEKFDFPNKKYKIIENFGNKEIIKQFGILK